MRVVAINLTPDLIHALWLPLGQTARGAHVTSQVWFYLAVMVGCIVVLVGVGYVAWRYITRPIETSQGEAAFNLSDLRKMHRQGELSDDEYLAARAVALVASGVQPGNPDPETDSTAPAPPKPMNRSGVELGPELLATDETPPADSDNPDQAPPAEGPA